MTVKYRRNTKLENCRIVKIKPIHIHTLIKATNSLYIFNKNTFDKKILNGAYTFYSSTVSTTIKPY